MSTYNFESIRPYDRARSDALRVLIERGLYPFDLLDAGPEAGRVRSGRFIIGQQAREVNPPPPSPAPGPGPSDRERPAPLEEVDRVRIRSGHYGGNTYGFHFQGATGGGGGNNEVRVSPYLEAEHVESKALWIVPYSGVASGQFLELRRSLDDNIVNTATPTGTLIGPNIGRVGSNPAPDNERAIAVPTEPTLLDTFRHGWVGGCYLKVRLYFVAPAVSLPVISVILSVVYKNGAGDFVFAVRS